jgi:hypothetical protein
MDRKFNLTALGTDMAFALLAAFMALWPQILTRWLGGFLASINISLTRMAALIIMLLLAMLLLFVNFWTLRHHPSRFVPALKQHGRHEMRILLQAALFALALFVTQIIARPIQDGLLLEHLFIVFSSLLLLFMGAFFRNELENDNQYLNNRIMKYITDILVNNPRVTQRILEGYMREQQIAGLIPRAVMASLARMLMVQ